MSAPESTLVVRESLATAAQAATDALSMDEESFRAFYSRTARPLWSYLCRASGDPALADDFLQESYLRLLGARLPDAEDAHRRRYLFRIATNLLRDHFRRTRRESTTVQDPRDDWRAPDSGLRSDVRNSLRHLKPKDRELLWLAYAEGYSHKEIADIMGFKAQSIRPLLFRARRRFAELLRRRGLGPDDLKIQR